MLNTKEPFTAILSIMRLFLGDRLQNGSRYAIRPLCVLSCLSETFVHCGQTVGRIKMKHGMQVGLGPGHIVLHGNPALRERATAATLC